MVTILIFLAVLAVLVLVHELGHFVAAKAFGVRVLEFGLGFPPRLLSIQRGGVVYSINALPLGGFVKLLGEEDPTEPESLASRGALTRLTVLGAGAAMNLFLALAIFALTFMIPQQVLEGAVRIVRVAPGSPAAEAGVHAGDVFVAIDGQPVVNNMEVGERIRMKLGERNRWELLRPQRLITGSLGGGGEPGLIPAPTTQGERIVVTLVPRWRPPAEEGNAGIVISTVDGAIVTRSSPVWEAVPKGVRRMGETLLLIRKEVTGWILGAVRPQIAGPIGIAQVTGEVARAGWVPLLNLAALLSLQLGILNILPIPALDGGRILFILIELVRRGKRISPERETLVHLVGFMAIIGAVVIVSYFDVVRVLQGESLLN